MKGTVLLLPFPLDGLLLTIEREFNRLRAVPRLWVRQRLYTSGKRVLENFWKEGVMERIQEMTKEEILAWAAKEKMTFDPNEGVVVAMHEEFIEPEVLANQMWEKYMKHLYELTGQTEKEMERDELNLKAKLSGRTVEEVAKEGFASKIKTIKRWAEELAKDTSWVPSQKTYYETLHGGGCKIIPMDFLRVG